MAESSIEWTDKVWNPTTGCTRVSAGCANCYAFQLHDMRHAAFLAGKKVPPQYARPFKELQMMPHRLADPLHWRKPCRIFVNSMSDLFHEDVPDEFIAEVFAHMARAYWHTFQVLTKRAERMRDLLSSERFAEIYEDVGGMAQEEVEEVLSNRGQFSPLARLTTDIRARDFSLPLPNVWLGVSTENQEQAAKRIPFLLQTPAAVRFLSCEPLLGPIDLRGVRVKEIDWVIVGGESGPKARPLNLAATRSIRDQCQAAGIPCFIKQLGPYPYMGIDGARGAKGILNLKDRKGGDIGEFPEDLRIRQWPQVERATV